MAANDGEIQRRRKVEYPLYYSPGKSLVHVVVKLDDSPGALARVLDALGRKVNLIGTNSYRMKSGQAIFSGFAEVISESEDARSIRALVEGVEGVAACDAWGSRQGLLVDRFHTGIQSGNGDPYMLLPAAALAQTFAKVVQILGSGGETVLYMEGVSLAATRFEAYRRMLGPDPTSRVEEASHIYEALGYGSSTITLEHSGKVVRLVEKDCFECSGAVKGMTGCSFMRGLAVGSFAAVLGKEMNADEVRCRLRGDEECEFVLSVKEN